MKIGITGITGFVGQNMSSFLTDFDILGISRESKGRNISYQELSLDIFNKQKAFVHLAGKAHESKKLEFKNENCEVENFSDIEKLIKIVAKEIEKGKVIGWFQGKMEWGPRALGNRSIICDPRRSDMKDILNLKIKRRESFRPFAPSVLCEDVPEWFEQNDNVPFMMQVYQINQNKRSKIPAVTHVDGSGRLQSVDKSTNPRYYQLIKEFKNLTNVPMILNTSFNENEPVVCKPEEALNTFLRTKMDVLVLGDWMIKRKN